METVLLNVEPRLQRGKEEMGRLRRQGKVPAVLYGPGKTTAAICVDAREFGKKLGGLEGSHLIQLLSPPQPDVHEKMALLREVQRHPVNNALIHIDLYEVDVTKPIEATVPLHFVGKAQGVTAGGILQTLRRDIRVQCLPREIPDFIEVDVTPLALYDSIHIAELQLPAGATAIYETNDAVVTVVSPTAAPAPEAAPVAAEGAAPVEAAPKAEKK